jgi:hypothetical protein
VTVSLGGAMATPGEGARSLATRADAALYRAKRHGRNRVSFAPATVGTSTGAVPTVRPTAALPPVASMATGAVPRVVPPPL